MTLALLWSGAAQAEDEEEGGSSGSAWSSYRDDSLLYKRDLAFRLREPMAAGMDVSQALEAWFAAAKATGADAGKNRKKAYEAGFERLKKLRPLGPTQWPKNPVGVTLKQLEEVRIPASVYQFSQVEKVTGVSCRIVEFKVGKLKEYGVIVQPTAPGKYPLILYMHGAAFGVPTYSLPWLARLAASGYVIAAPALRGEDLFTSSRELGLAQEYRCEGKIENLIGEVDDGLAIVDGAFKLDTVAGGKFAVVGHSFGSGAGLLVAARSAQVSCVVSYDAWLTNPFRYYWDRLRDGANNWLSWEEYVEAHTVPEQLAGLKARSIVHNVGKVQAPMLLFIGGAYNGSVFHESHADLAKELRRLKKDFVYDIVPGGGHNFVLYCSSDPAQYAYKVQTEWLTKHHPPRPPKP